MHWVHCHCQRCARPRHAARGLLHRATLSSAARWGLAATAIRTRQGQRGELPHTGHRRGAGLSQQPGQHAIGPHRAARASAAARFLFLLEPGPGSLLGAAGRQRQQERGEAQDWRHPRYPSARTSPPTPSTALADSRPRPFSRRTGTSLSVCVCCAPLSGGQRQQWPSAVLPRAYRATWLGQRRPCNFGGCNFHTVPLQPGDRATPSDASASTRWTSCATRCRCVATGACPPRPALRAHTRAIQLVRCSQHRRHPHAWTWPHAETPATRSAARLATRVRWCSSFSSASTRTWTSRCPSPRSRRGL